ncbi:hypothetical protein [Actinokineospora enzanensis]|uniref:hypothetical protein n=1 Tax=Actinokineospora enzanensis TaxID=155975 RepID=UPI0003617932|nr:hypothetical protein [Actinokineospora enzanensis]
MTEQPSAPQGDHPTAEPTAQQVPAQQPPFAADQAGVWGAPAAPKPPRQRWTWKKTAAAAAIAAGVATAGGFAVYAASGATADTQGGRGGMGGPGMDGGRGGFGGGMGGAGLQNALHGEFVVSTGDGAYATRLMQTGEVTAVSDTSITAKSTDGYTKTYTIDSQTVKSAMSSVAQGDTVTIIATTAGDTASVASISERGTGSGSTDGGGPGMGPGGQDNQQGVPPRRDDDDSDSTQPTA